MSWRATIHAYCGLRILMGRWASLPTARQAVAHRLRYLRRRRYQVACLERGCRWEINEPAKAILIDEELGVLVLECEGQSRPRKRGNKPQECLNEDRRHRGPS